MLHKLTPTWFLWFFALIALASLRCSAAGGVEVVEIENLQFSRTIVVTVTDPVDKPIPHLKVEEMDAGWKHLIRSTETDAHGCCTLDPSPKGNIYYLQLSSYGFNPLRVPVKVSTNKGKALWLAMELAT